MKIVIAMPSFYGQSIGGAEYQAFLIAKEIIRKGHEVHYIFLSNKETIINSLKNCKLHPVTRIKHTSRSGIEIPLYYFKISNILKKINPDLIYTRGRSAVSIICGIFSKLNKVKAVYHISHDHNLIDYKYNLSIKETIKWPEKRAFPAILKNFDKIIAQTQFQAEILQKKYGIESNIIPNGQPVENIKNIDKSASKTMVLWIANLKHNKQPEIFIQLAKILSQNSKFLFIMIGKKYKNRFIQGLKNINSTNVKYVGQISHEEVNEYLNKGHILVNTSIAEGFSNTFIQAWMRRVPVISLYCDPDNVIKRQGIGYVSNNFDQLLSDVKRLMTDCELREIMGRKARKFAMKEYSLNNIKRTADLLLHK